MLKVDVDIFPVVQLSREAENRLSNEAIGDTMKRILDQKMAEERGTHLYNNYTYRLEGSTFALGPLPYRSNGVMVIAGARMPYASHVERRGRTRVRELTLSGATEIEYQFTIGDMEDLSRM